MSGKESEKDYGDIQIAERIAEVRRSSGLSADAFAARLGVSQPTQSRIERAKRLPDALYLRALRQQFHVDINALLAGDEQPLAPANSVNVHVSGGTVMGHVVAGTMNVGAAVPVKRARTARKTTSGV